MSSTLDDGQQDDDDEEEEGDVEQDAVELVGVSSRVLQLVSNASSSSHTDIHVEQIALWREKKARPHVIRRKHLLCCLRGNVSSHLLLEKVVEAAFNLSPIFVTQ